MRAFTHTLLTSSALLLAQAIAAASHAQESGSSVRGADAAQFDEIVVTARKRNENLQDVPTAVTALGVAQMQDAGAVDIRDVARLTPGLFYRAFSNQVPTLWMRGIGTRSYDAGAEASIGTFIDGVYIGRFGAQLQDLADVERVEVLRGPQGALFGRNTIGGALSIVTRRPTEEFLAKANVTYGHAEEVGADTINVSGLLSGPIVGDKLLGQLSMSRSDFEGTTELQGTDRMANGTGTESVRGRLVLDPSDSLRLDLSADWFSSVADKYNWVWHGSNAGGTRPVVYGSLGALQLTDPDSYESAVTPPRSDANREGWGSNLTLDYRPRGVTLTSITAYRELDTDYYNDIDTTALATAITTADESSWQFSEELRLASEDGGPGTLDGRLDWLFGLYYFRESIDRVDGIPTGPDGFIVAGTDFAAEVETASWAAFAQLGIAITEALKLDLGLRYGEDDKEGDFATTGFLTFGFPFAVENDDSWDSLDPSVTLSYHFDDDVMAFVKYATGFKSGAYQYAAATALAARNVAEPEELESWEAGLRADWLDRSLRTNLNVFDYDYKDMQVPRVDSSAGFPIVVVSNAATSRVRGVELEAAAHLGDRLEFNLNYSWLDATYDDYVYSPALDFSGNDLVRAPQDTLGAALLFVQPLPIGELRARVGVEYVSSFHFETDNAKVDPGTEEPSHTTVDASLALLRGDWEFRLWGNNVTDEEVRATVLNVGSPFLLNEMWMPRRTIGLTVGVTFE